MAKKKGSPRGLDGHEDGAREPSSVDLQPTGADAPDGEEMLDIDALRASVAGTAAERALDAIEAAFNELERAYVEVAELGKQLAQAREQLRAHEAELRAARARAVRAWGDDPASPAGQPERPPA
jgi:hypothetical protein